MNVNAGSEARPVGLRSEHLEVASDEAGGAPVATTLARLAERLAVALDCSECCIYEFLPERDVVLPKAIWSLQLTDEDRAWVGVENHLHHQYEVAPVFTDHRIVITQLDEEDLPPNDRESMAYWGEKTALYAPIMNGDEPLGVVELVEKRERREFTEADLRLVMGLADVAAVAIANARRSERLSNVLEVSRTVGGSLDPDEVVDAVCARLSGLFPGRETVVTVERAEAAPVATGGAPRETVGVHGRRLAVPLVSKGRSRGDLVITSPSPQAFDGEERELAQIVANQVAVALENAALCERLEEQAMTDGLTGLYNHRFFYERLNAEVVRARRYGFQISLLMLDLDDFKRFNDDFGHQAGDRVLSEVGKIMREQLRKDVDVPCRYGGEEFAIILPHTPAPGAETVGRRLIERLTAIVDDDATPDPAWLTGERVRRSIEGAPFPGHAPDETTHITVSVGVATYPAQASDANTLVGNADKALYVAKHRGKNRVELYA